MFNFQTKTLVILILVTMEALARGKEIISNVLVEKGIQENSAKVSIEFIHEPPKRNNSFKPQIVGFQELPTQEMLITIGQGKSHLSLKFILELCTKDRCVWCLTG